MAGLVEDGYDGWSRRGADATRAGDFEAALDAYAQARGLAQDARQRTAASLNLAMVLLQTDRWREGEEGLREILLSTDDTRVAFSAAYHLASSLRRQSKHERALAYARRAMERAEQLGAPEYLAPAHNLLGNIQLAQSHLDDALGSYRRSLEIRLGQDEDTRWSQAILLENVGYCLLLLGRHDEALSRIREALELADQTGDRRCRAECLQDLCFGLLLAGELDGARPHGEQALEIAESAGYGDIRENCHYLLAEIGTRTNDSDLRDRHLDRLQELHPELPFLRDFLAAVDVTSVLSLKR
jgi:tetratricopeptide (TPR) repeat protein